MTSKNPPEVMFLIGGQSQTTAAITRHNGVTREYKIKTYRRAQRIMQFTNCIKWKLRRTVITPNGVTVWLDRQNEVPMKPKYRLVVYDETLAPVGVEEIKDEKALKKRVKTLDKMGYFTQVFVLNEHDGKYQGLAWLEV